RTCRISSQNFRLANNAIAGRECSSAECGAITAPARLICLMADQMLSKCRLQLTKCGTRMCPWIRGRKSVIFQSEARSIRGP
ncbi:hypothetical protein HAX54_001859, partial [Datura stramonium]|nr:hypothetical protein [Datura stramonium]